MQLGENFMGALRMLADERGLSEEVILKSVEAALALAYRKYREAKEDPVKNEPVVTIDPSSGLVSIFDVRRVGDDEATAPGDIGRDEARALPGFSEAVAGDLVNVPVLEEPASFGRIAAQVARQVISQKLRDAERGLREAERGALYSQFSDRIGTLVSATIFKKEGEQIIVRLPDHTEAVLPQDERIAGEEYETGASMKFFLLDVRQSSRGGNIVVSRTHPGLLRKLLEVEIPEIQSGTVEIKGIVREAGARAKVAVVSNDPDVDPVGACVGSAGARIRNVSAELCDEKIDIIVWSEDPLEFIKNALSPASVTSAEAVAGQERTAKVYAPADQLSLAIGKAGQNVRLAARLTGWKVDINTDGEPSGKAGGETGAGA